MIAIGFTNCVFLAYCIYVGIEKKGNFYKNKWFWLALLGLMLSAYLAYVTLYPTAIAAIPSEAVAP